MIPRRTAGGGRALVRSLTGLSWAAMVSGLRLGGRTMWAPVTFAPSPDLRRIARLGRAGVDEAAAAVYRAGDRLQGSFVDLVFDVAEEELALRRWLRAGMRLMSDGAWAASLVLPAEAGAPWLELHNKLEAFRRFEGVEATLGMSLASPADLPAALEKAAALGPYPALWSVEGLGHRIVELAGDEDPRGLLGRAEQPELPDRSLIALHAGLGLGLAGRVLAAPQAAAGGELRRSLDRFLDLCRANSRPGYAEVAFEALGLIARTLYPERMERIDAELRRIDPALADYFWHGVGRGLYFAPTQALPLGASWRRAVDQCRRQSPDERARRNALAGYSWALALVNIVRPRVVAEFLDRCGAELDRDDPVAHGLVAAVLVWRAAAGRDGVLESFLSYRPPAGGAAADRWQRLVRRPGEEALAGPYDALARSGRLGVLFRYQPLAELGRDARDLPPPPSPAAGGAERSGRDR